MSKKTKIVLADDHPIYRDGLRQILDGDAQLELVHAATNGREALDLARKCGADVLLLDIDMPVMTGLEAAKERQQQGDKFEVIFLTMHRDEDLFNEALDLDVKGFVLKDSAAEDIQIAIRTVADGRPYISPMLSQLMMNRMSGADKLRKETPGLDDLTASERRILKLIASDRTSKEIAGDLGLSPRTVDNHRTNICNKLGIHGSHGLLKFAFENRSKL